MHTSPSLGQIVLERPDPTLLAVRSIPGVALEIAVRAPAPFTLPSGTLKNFAMAERARGDS